MQGQTKIEGFFGKREQPPVAGPAASVEFPAGHTPLPEYTEDAKNMPADSSAAFHEAKEQLRFKLEKEAEEKARAQVNAAPSDMMTFFAENWTEFQQFVAENVVLLQDQTAIEYVRSVVNKMPELALITLAVKLPAHAQQILANDLKYFIDLALPHFDARQLNFPSHVVERGFGFFLLFLGILQAIQAGAQ
jgi:hypothetical protein